MHDPMVVAFEIPSAFPSIRRKKRRSDVRRVQIRYSWRKWYDLRPAVFSKFWQLGDVEVYWRPMFTIWHVEPDGRDSGDVCPHHARWQDETGQWHTKPLHGWKWHVHHWRIQWHLHQKVRRALLTKCEECGRRGSPNISHQWDRDRGAWWRGERGLYHRECSSLVSYRHTEAVDKELIRFLVSALRVASDESEEQVVARLTNPKTRGMEFSGAYRLTRVMGFERDDDYNLVRKPVDAP